MENKSKTVLPKFVYLIKDENGKIWDGYASTDKRSIVRRFVRDWFSRLKQIDDYDAHSVWRIFEKNGYSVEEIELNKESYGE